jgi:hypothetical protein
MNNTYLKALDDIAYIRARIERAYNEGTTKTFEDKKAYKVIEKLLDQLQDAESDLKYYSLPVREGRLYESSSGKYVVSYDRGGESYPLSCGSPLEVYFDHEDWDNDIDNPGWYSGRVEHNGKGYYFYGHGNPMLYSGMRARLRERE